MDQQTNYAEPVAQRQDPRTKNRESRVENQLAARGSRFWIWLRIAFHIGAWIPLAVLIWDFMHNQLTVNPIQEATFRTGKTALILLALALTCTPANIIFGIKQALP